MRARIEVERERAVRKLAIRLEERDGSTFAFVFIHTK